MKKSDNQKIQELETQLLNEKQLNDRLLSENNALKANLKKLEQEKNLFDRKILEINPLQRSLEDSYRKEKKLKTDISNLKEEVLRKSKICSDLEKSLRFAEEQQLRELNEKLEAQLILNKNNFEMTRAEIVRQSNKSIIERKKFEQEKENLMEKIRGLQNENNKKENKIQDFIEISENLIRNNELLLHENQTLKSENEDFKKKEEQYKKNPENQHKFEGIQKIDSVFVKEDEEKKEESVISMVESEELIVHESDEN